MSTKDHEQHFDTAQYLSRYYASVSDENQQLLEFLHEVYSGIGSCEALLELGGGPTIYQLISASPMVETIIFSDYLEDNRHAVSAWLGETGHAYSWRAFFEYLVRLEDKTPPLTTVDERKARLRKQIQDVIHCDIREDDPLQGTTHAGQDFDVVSMFFVLEAIDECKQTCGDYLANVDRLVRPGGHLVMGAIIGTSGYHVGGNQIQTANVSMQDVLAWLETYNYDVQLVREIDSHMDDDYEALGCVWATKR